MAENTPDSLSPSTSPSPLALRVRKTVLCSATTRRSEPTARSRVLGRSSASHRWHAGDANSAGQVRSEHSAHTSTPLDRPTG
jgi:hypothetical protein